MADVVAHLLLLKGSMPLHYIVGSNHAPFSITGLNQYIPCIINTMDLIVLNFWVNVWPFIATRIKLTVSFPTFLSVSRIKPTASFPTFWLYFHFFQCLTIDEKIMNETSGRCYLLFCRKHTFHKELINPSSQNFKGKVIFKLNSAPKLSLHLKSPIPVVSVKGEI